MGGIAACPGNALMAAPRCAAARDKAQFVKHPKTLVENPGDVRNMLIVDGATARLSRLYSGTLSLFCHIAFPVE